MTNHIYEPLKVFALTNDRARLVAHEATVDDWEAAMVLQGCYLGRGYIVKVHNAEGKGGPVHEWKPADRLEMEAR
jgi:hypothetical protein